MSLKRIHLFGSGPRTGTTLLYELMSTCFEIDGLIEHEAHVSDNPRKKCNIFLTKHPSGFFAINTAMKFNKRLYGICIIRDPRDAIISYHGSLKQKYWASLRYWIEFLKAYKTLRDNTNILFISYEDLVKSPDKTQNLLIKSFSFLNKKVNFSDFHNFTKPSSKSKLALKGVRKVAPKESEWMNHLPRIKQQILIHGDISKSLIAFGYEKNDEWMTKLNDVEAIDYDSYWKEYFTKKDLFKRKLIGYNAIFKHFFYDMFGFDFKNFKQKLKRLCSK